MTMICLQEELESLKASSLYRELKSLEPLSATHADWDGNKLILFCGNDYLGLSHHPRVLYSAQKTLKHFGLGAGAARLISGTSTLHTQLEEKLAEMKGKEKALVYGSGYLANLGVMTALMSEKDLIVMDKLCHASLIDAARLSKATLRVFPHKNYERCEELLNKEGYERKLLVSDAVFSMDGDIADFEKLIATKEKTKALLMVDDAHGTGVLGLEGKGAHEDSNFGDGIDIFTATLSKALGAYGGFVAANREIIDYLINKSRPFIYATALPSLVCAGALEGLQVIEDEPILRQRLWQNIQRMHEGLVKLGYEMAPIQSPILPIIVQEEERALALSRELLEKGILVPAIRYPTVAKGSARLRVTVSAQHTAEEIDYFLSTLSTYTTA